MTRSKLLKWAGSKSQIIEKIAPHLDFNASYIEPFCGSAAFFFEKRPKDSHLNDSNTDLINFFDHTRSNPEEVWGKYNGIEVCERQYYTVREEFNSIEHSAEKAGIFLYLNHFCFNGIYRTNKKGNFNTPYGAQKKIKKKISFDEFLEFSKVLRGAKLYSLDFEEFLFSLSPRGSCIYMDPPYFTNDERVFGEYGASTFKAGDLQRLFDLSKYLSKNNKVVVSYKKCSEFLELFEEHIVTDISVMRNVGGFAGRRKIETEVIAVLGGVR